MGELLGVLEFGATYDETFGRNVAPAFDYEELIIVEDGNLINR